MRARHWDQQKQAGIDLLPVGDFAWYDHVLTTSLLLGNVPQRHQNNDGSVDIDTCSVLVVDVHRLANLRRQRK